MQVACFLRSPWCSRQYSFRTAGGGGAGPGSLEAAGVEGEAHVTRGFQLSMTRGPDELALHWVPSS